MLTFKDDSFQTVSILATLGHIPKSIRQGVLGEARRTLTDDGVILITSISPLIGFFSAQIGLVGPRSTERGIQNAENIELTFKAIISLLEDSGYRLIEIVNDRPYGAITRSLNGATLGSPNGAITGSP